MGRLRVIRDASDQSYFEWCTPCREHRLSWISKFRHIFPHTYPFLPAQLIFFAHFLKYTVFWENIGFVEGLQGSRRHWQRHSPRILTFRGNMPSFASATAIVVVCVVVFTLCRKKLSLTSQAVPCIQRTEYHNNYSSLLSMFFSSSLLDNRLIIEHCPLSFAEAVMLFTRPLLPHPLASSFFLRSH